MPANVGGRGVPNWNRLRAEVGSLAEERQRVQAGYDAAVHGRLEGKVQPVAGRVGRPGRAPADERRASVGGAGECEQLQAVEVELETERRRYGGRHDTTEASTGQARSGLAKPARM